MPCATGDDYRILHGLGEGAYGTVVAAVHKPSGREVAIKKVLPFEHTLFCLRTLRELKLLKFFSDSCVNENVRLDYGSSPQFVANSLLFSPRPSATLYGYVDYLHSRYHQAALPGRIQGDLLCVIRIRRCQHPSIFLTPPLTVIQELMQTDLHRVIRTQQLTDDHCQVRVSILR